MNIISKIWLVLSLILFASCATKKIYAPSQTQTTQRVGFLENEQIDVIFFDSRTEKEKSDEVKNSIFTHLKKTYSSAKFQMQESSKYFSSPSDGIITIKINIAGYNADYGLKTTSGIGSVNGTPFVFNGISDAKWNGITGFQVTINDQRNDQKKYTQNISEVVSKPNTWGYKTARKALQESFQNALHNLDLFIDQSLME